MTYKWTFCDLVHVLAGRKDDYCANVGLYYFYVIQAI